MTPRPRVGRSQAPLTSPCPPSNHTITLNLTPTHGGCSQPMCDPKGCATILGAVAPPPPWLTQTLGVSRSGGQPPGSPGGGGGTPTYIPQNDPHDALIIYTLYIYLYTIGVKKFFKKILPINSLNLAINLGSVEPPPPPPPLGVGSWPGAARALTVAARWFGHASHVD